MKFKALLFILLGMALSGQLLAPMAMAGCMGIGGTTAGDTMSAGEHHGMQMAGAGHVDEHAHHLSPAADGAAFSGDCCHMGHTGHCPMASCLTVALSGLIRIDSPHVRPLPPVDHPSHSYEQHSATHYRPPIFA